MQVILQAKESIITNFKTNAPASRKHSCSARYQDVDNAVYEWYGLASEQLVPVSGHMQAEVLLLAKELGNESFKASNGLVAKLQAEAQHCTSCSRRGGM